MTEEEIRRDERRRCINIVAESQQRGIAGEHSEFTEGWGKGVLVALRMLSSEEEPEFMDYGPENYRTSGPRIKPSSPCYAWDLEYDSIH